MIDFETAVSLKHGATIHHTRVRQNNGKDPYRVRVTGKVRTWKTRPGEFSIPVKHGLRDSYYITHENGADWVLP